jgi:hypothetical protein
MSRIPLNASQDVQQAFRELWLELDRIRRQAQPNLNLSGKRVMNAGDGQQLDDLATVGQVQRAVTRGGGAASGDDLSVRSLKVAGRALFLAGQIFIPVFTDGSSHHCILWVDANGAIAVDEEHLSYNDATNELELGFATRVRFLNSASVGSPDPGYLSLGNAHDTGFTMLILGPTRSAAFPGLRRNGTTLEVLLGDESDLTNVKAQLFIPKNRHTYSPSNVTARRTGDFSLLTPDEVRDVVGTLIQDLQDAGLLG